MNSRMPSINSQRCYRIVIVCKITKKEYNFGVAFIPLFDLQLKSLVFVCLQNLYR